MSDISVLVIDSQDSAYIRDLQRTYNIEIAESVLDAMEKTEQSHFDAVIIDIDLIGLNLLPSVKKLCPGTVFIAVSAGKSMRTVVDVMRMGFYDCVFHPFPSGYLTTSINKGIRAFSMERDKVEDIAAMARQKGSVQAVIQSMSAGLIITDTRQHVVFCNSKAAELLDKKVLVGIPISRHIGQPPEPSMEPMGLEIKTSAGTALMRTLPVTDYQASRVGWVSVLTDITEFKKTGRLMSEAAMRCTHEIRAPLAAVRSYLALLLDESVGNLNHRQRIMLTRMVKRVDALLELERELLDLSSIEAGGLSLDTELLSLAELMRELTDTMRPSAVEKGVRMRLLVEPEPLTMLADRSALKRVFTNLVSNAIKYTPSGGTVQIRVGRDGDRGFTEVVDTGIGISAENVPRIFDKFFRVRDRETAEIVGTGLGLPIVKALVDAHSGEIKVESEAGRGSTFRVFLPIVETVAVHKKEPKVLNSEEYILLNNLDTNFKAEGGGGEE